MATCSGPQQQPLPSHRNLTGTNVLVAEDDAIIGMYIEELLRDAVCIVLGPLVSVTDALTILETKRPLTWHCSTIPSLMERWLLSQWL